MLPSFIVWLKDADTDDVSSVGKTGRDISKLAQVGFPVLPGFIVTSDAYFLFLKQNKLEDKIKKLLTTVNLEQPDSVYQVAQHIKKHIEQTPLPQELVDELILFHEQLDGIQLTINAHATSNLAHKISNHSVEDFEQLIKAVKNAWTSHFEPNHFWKRHEHKHDHLTTGVELIVQAALDADKTGTIHTIDPQDHKKDSMVITINKSHTSDSYTLTKKNLMIIDRSLSHDKKNELDSDEIVSIGQLGKELEQYLYFPQVVSWSIVNDQLFLLATKPIHSIQQEKPIKRRKLALSRGTPITTTIGTGKVRILKHDANLKDVQEHDIIVLPTITKEHLKQLKRVRGIITEKGERHSEVSALIKQLGIPTVFHVKDATKRFKNGHIITIHGGKGEIYKGGFH